MGVYANNLVILQNNSLLLTLSHTTIPTCTLSVYNSLWNTLSVKARQVFYKYHVLQKYGTSWTCS